MRERQFASLDAWTLSDTSPGQRTARDATARRSLSIFSRRGAETPEPVPPFITQSAIKPSKGMTEKQQRWVKRKTAVVSSGNSFRSLSRRGTVLNAVPPRKSIHMTALEEEMATSPNDEILFNIGAESPSSSRPTSQSFQAESFWSRNSTSLDRQTSSPQKRPVSNSRIGVWVDGVAHWDNIVLAGPEEDSQLLTGEEIGFTPLRPASIAGNALSAKKQPSSQVPVREPFINTLAVSTITQPKPQRPIVSVAPASIVSRFSAGPASLIDEPLISPVGTFSSNQVSPIVDTFDSPIHAAAAQTLAVHAPREATPGSSSRCSTVDRDDASSDAKSSHRSSRTSIEASPLETASAVLIGPHQTAIEVKTSGQDEAFAKLSDRNKPLPPHPIETRPLAAHLPSEVPIVRQPVIRRRPRSASSSKSAPADVRAVQLSTPPLRTSHSLTALDPLRTDFSRALPLAASMPLPGSPTLNGAEKALEMQLSTVQVDKDAAVEPAALSRGASLLRSGSVHSVMHPPERAPSLPKRSRKREWRQSAQQFVLPEAPKVLVRRSSVGDLREAASMQVQGEPSSALANIRKNKSINAMDMMKVRHFAQLLRSPAGSQETLTSALTPLRSFTVDDGLIVVEGPVSLWEQQRQAAKYTVDVVAATEQVLLRILGSLATTKDLFNTAMINKGMYRVFKTNELRLIQEVTFNQSPAAWEFREWCPPSHNDLGAGRPSSVLQHTPKSYLTSQRRDTVIISSLKKLMLHHCQSFMRRETMRAISSKSHPQAQRFDDAVWRIWCFCSIFGYGKGREDDITGQVDWLKGGLLANSQGCVATVNTNLDFELSSILLNPPEHFAKGNAGGLTAQQLYDMTELWTCLHVLLNAYHGRTAEARTYGVYDLCSVRRGDQENEERVLEEWLHYLMTLGPAVVLDMATSAQEDGPAGFALARQAGWTQWAPCEDGGSRSTFLKDPVSRLYEELVFSPTVPRSSSVSGASDQVDRTHKRVANLAADIKLKRQSSVYSQTGAPTPNPTSRSASALSHRSATAATDRTILSAISTTIHSTPSTHPINRRQSISSPHSRISPLPSTPNFSTPRPYPSLSAGPTPTAATTNTSSWASPHVSPIIEDRVQNFNRLSLLHFAGGVAEDTSDRAIRKIVEMGFSTEQAKNALRATDLGDGLRVDRAVELLTRARC